MVNAILFTKALRDNPFAASWPVGTRVVAFDEARHPAACHHLLERGYARGQGEVPAYADCWQGLRSDSEYSAARTFVAVDAAARPVAFAQCWTSAFLKDFAVDIVWRRRGLGRAMLTHVFEAFRQDGFETLRLKVRAANRPAIAFYEALGMVRER